MAAIEKICEYSSDYHGWLMRKWKNNHIQICPEYRKLFRKANHILFIQKSKEYKVFYDSKRDYYSFMSKDRYDSIEQYDFRKNYYQGDIIKYNGLFYKCGVYNFKQINIVNEYNYCLKVFDEHLQGRVDGCYFESSIYISTVKRKLKRMLRVKILSVIVVDENLDFFDFVKNYQK